VDGPPPDPRIVSLPTGLADDPSGHALCIGLALVALGVAWRCRSSVFRGAWAGLAVVVAFTSPWLAWTTRAWFGDFPTIDKEGSLLFFLDGVHLRLYLHPLSAPADDAVRLIGVHAGHLWVTEALATVLGPMGAFNAQWLLQAGLGWAAAAWAISVLTERRDGGVRPWVAWVAAFPFGMGLHLFRDLNWTTVEKGGVAFIPLFIGCWVRSVRHGGWWTLAAAGTYLAMALYNLYFAVVCAVLGAVYLGVEALPRLGERRLKQVGMVALGCALVGVPVALAQLAIQAGGPALATPERFLWERAALDGFTLVPLRWNRLEVWRACNPVAVGLAMVGAWHGRRDPRVWRALVLGGVLFVVSLGPVLLPGDSPREPTLTNPVYMALHAVVPGFWRLAKPEVFFQPVWLLTLVGAALGLQHVARRSCKNAVVLAVLLLAVWWPLVRGHAHFPGLSAPLDSALDPRWQDRVFEDAD